MSAVVFCASDPGGGQAIRRVASTMSRAHEVTFLAGGATRTVLKSHEQAWEDGDAMDDETLAGRLQTLNPAAIILGTSAGSTLDKRVGRWAASLGVPRVGVLDYWSNYAMRFTDESGNAWRDFPDVLCVMDDHAADALAALGVSRDALRITGNPQFDEFVLSQDAWRPQQGRILFASQPLELMERAGMASYGYTERDVMTDLARLVPALPADFHLAIRRHPKEDLEAFRDLMECAPKGRLVDDAISDPAHSIVSSHIVTGMHSMLLFQAAMMGIPTLSYQPGLRRDDPLVCNAWGWSRRAISYPLLAWELRELLSSPTRDTLQPPKRQGSLALGATERVTEVVQSYL